AARAGSDCSAPAPDRKEPRRMTAPGADFWTALGVRHEPRDRPKQSRPLKSSRRDLPATDPSEWSAMFSSWTEKTVPDSGPAGQVTDVVGGWRLIDELWRDERIGEIHVRGTEVTVYGTHGVHPATGFATLDVARRTLQAVIAAATGLGATVSRISDSVVISRPGRTGPDLAA